MTESQSEVRENLPAPLKALGGIWVRLSARLVPIFAVLTAFLAGIPLMIITGGGGNIAQGLQVSGIAYSALIEGSIGIVINDIADETDFTLLRQLAEVEELESNRLSRQARPFEKVADIGVDNIPRYLEFLSQYPDVTPDDWEAIAEALPAARRNSDISSVPLPRELTISLNSPEADLILEIVEADVDDVIEAEDTLERMAAAGITTPAELGEDFRLMGNLYNEELINPEITSVNEALETEVDAAITDNLVIRRPGNEILYGVGMGADTYGVFPGEQDVPVSFSACRQ